MDIPIQHINDRILKLMGRKTTREEIEGLLRKLREKYRISLYGHR